MIGFIRRIFGRNELKTVTSFSTWIGGVMWGVYLLLDLLSNGTHGGWIGRLFLLAPLLVLPLALWIILQVSDRGEGVLFRAAVWLQPFAALSLVASFGVRRPALEFLPQNAGLAIYLTIPWLILCGLLLFGEGWYVLNRHVDDFTDGMILPPVMFLQVGGFWLMIDQMDVPFMGITEPIRLLTGVHFHFTGFGVLVLFAGLHELFLKSSRGNRAFLTVLASAGVVAGIPMVAIGFLGADMVKSTGVIVLSVSMGLGAVLLFQSGRLIEDPYRAFFVRFAAGSVVIGMMLAMVFQISLHLGRPVLSIPVMTVSHGVLNGIGFMILGLTGIKTGLIECGEET